MLGFYRYLLALMVALSHLASGWLYWQGAYAVFCFYLISGYLMSHVLNRVYTGASGIRGYAANRALRIYPVYLAVLLLSVLVAGATTGIHAQQTGTGLPYATVMPIPATAAEWLGNILLVFPWDVPLQITQGWSLRVELFYYALMPLLVRQWWVVTGWFLLSLLYCAWGLSSQIAFVEQYTTLAGASVAFSTGALIYHLRARFQLAAFHLPVALIIYFLHTWFAPQLWSFPRQNELGFAWLFQAGNYGLYGNLLCGAYLLYAIVSRDGRDGPVERWGSALGDLAYPIFLCHWVAGAVVAGLGWLPAEGIAYLVLSLLLVHLLSPALHYLVEVPVNRGLRDRIRAATVSHRSVQGRP